MKYTVREFAKQIRDLYPGDYDDLSDEKLTTLWLKKYPKDIDKVDLNSNESKNNSNSFLSSKIIVLMVIALISFGTYYLFNSKKSNNNSQNNTELTNPSTGDSPLSTKSIEWSNGNVYNYDYIQTSNIFKDSLGNETTITIYRSNKPPEEDIICKSKICMWCNNKISSIGYEIEEFPNVDFLLVNEENVNNDDILNGVFMISQILTSQQPSEFFNPHYDFENNRIRTEWNINCKYERSDNFCSEKCQYENKAFKDLNR